MRFRPVLRTALAQGLALAGFIVAWAWLAPAVPTPRVEPDDEALLAHSLQSPDRPPEVSDKSTDTEATVTEPARPERFRPSATPADESTAADLPSPVGGRSHVNKTVTVPAEPLPLSYLMHFKSLDEFHGFLDNLPPAGDDPTMSLVHIDGLPGTVEDLRRLFASYRMDPFLFNPEKFNYVVTSDGSLLDDRKAIARFIAAVGRYLHNDRPGPAWQSLRDEMVEDLRSRRGIVRRFGSGDEFDYMKLALASPSMNRFFARLETDTASQITRLLGRTVRRQDIARIDCRFRRVGESMVLVPWTAHLGRGEPRSVRLWDES